MTPAIATIPGLVDAPIAADHQVIGILRIEDQGMVVDVLES